MGGGMRRGLKEADWGVLPGLESTFRIMNKWQCNSPALRACTSLQKSPWWVSTRWVRLGLSSVPLADVKSGKREGTGGGAGSVYPDLQHLGNAEDKDTAHCRAAQPLLSPRLFVFQGSAVVWVLGIYQPFQCPDWQATCQTCYLPGSTFIDFFLIRE